MPTTVSRISILILQFLKLFSIFVLHVPVNPVVSHTVSNTLMTFSLVSKLGNKKWIAACVSKYLSNQIQGNNAFCALLVNRLNVFGLSTVLKELF